MANVLQWSVRVMDGPQVDIAKLASPHVWQKYKESLLYAVTEGAKSTVQVYASSLWKNPTGALDNSWFTTYDMANLTSTIYNSKGYAYWQNYGVNRHQMTYLLNSEPRTYSASWGSYVARPPIPIKDGKSGNIAFRTPTKEAMEAGKWWHPGYRGKDFLRLGVLEYQAVQMPKDTKDVFIKIMG